MQEVRVLKTDRSMERVAERLSEWIERELDFPKPTMTREGEALILRAEKKDVLRQISGLVFELTITFVKTGNGFAITVDNGDIRKQLAGLGIGWLFFWPLIVSAGYGYFANNEVVHRVIRVVERAVSE